MSRLQVTSRHVVKLNCFLCRATLSNCNALYYHMNYVHSGAVEPMDIIRKMVTSEGMVKQEHMD